MVNRTQKVLKGYSKGTQRVLRSYMGSKRIIIYPKDVQLITGKSVKYGRELLKKIKKKNAKRSDQLVSISEFAAFTGISVDEVRSLIKD